jgi:hypothetical protein
MSTEMAVALTGAAGTVLAAVATAMLPNILGKIRRADEKIETLRFLVTYLVTEPERNHLRRISSRERFMVRTDDNFDSFRDEIRHLLNLRFIDYHQNAQGLDLFREGGPVERYVDEHCEIREPGREYLKLVNEVSKPS